ncbi:MAG: CHAT domain-containing protein [Planctomycetota bacterium]
MDTLVLQYHVAPPNRVQLTPVLRKNGGGEKIWATETQLADYPRTVELSQQIRQAMQDAVSVMGSGDNGLDLEAAAGHLETIRCLGDELRKALLPDGVVRRLQANQSIRHIIFRFDPLLNGVFFEAMVLWGDFVCFRYAAGRELLTQERGQADRVVVAIPGYHGVSLVDPGRLLVNQGAHSLPAAWQDFQASANAYANKIRFEGRAFRPTNVEEVSDAVKHHDFVNLICHHRYDEEKPQESGFLLGPDSSFTAQDLLRCLDAGARSPLLMFSVACESGITRGWEAEWGPNCSRLYGMVDAALRRGVGHYVSTVIRVPVGKSPELLQPFYERLVEGATVGQSLQAAREKLRGDSHDPLHGGSVLGLAFIVYGDPARAYFCAEGHRIDGASAVACEAPLDGSSRCDRVICQKEGGFGHRRCNLHWKEAQITCSAGHAVQRLNHLVECTDKGGCHNTLCPDCAGSGKQLCWEHCCHSGHPIVGNAKKICRDPQGNHPDEKRSICPLDDGWMQGLCAPCVNVLAARVPESCPHCGSHVHEGNPWAGACGDPDCAEQLCKHCISWHEQTMMCPKTGPGISEEQRKTGWMNGLYQRAQRDADLATTPRLWSGLATAKAFHGSLATNVNEQTRRGSLMPVLRVSMQDVIVSQPRLRTVKLNSADLSQELVDALFRRWNLPAARDPAPGNHDGRWKPPPAWLEAYGQTNQLRVHTLNSFLGRRVVVAVVTLCPVQFERKRGPVMISADADHLERIKAVIAKWYVTECGKEMPDTYLIIHSTAGWAGQTPPPDEPGWLGILAEPQQNTWKMHTPDLEGRPPAVQEFVRLLTPETVYRRKTKVRQWIQSKLELEDHISLSRAQRELEKELERQVGDQQIEEAFGSLARTGKYVVFSVDGRPALRLANASERRRHFTRRWWCEIAAVVAGVLAALFKGFLFVMEHRRSMIAGTFGIVIVCYVGGHVFKRITQFLKQS